jgi:hypothetical protein
LLESGVPLDYRRLLVASSKKVYGTFCSMKGQSDMLRNRICKDAGFTLTGFIAGIALLLILGFAKDRDENEKEILPKNTFGDLRIVTESLKRSDSKGMMTLRKGGMPIIFIYINDANEVDRFAIVNGAHGLLALGRLGKSGISEFAVYGNEVHDGGRTPVLLMVASDKPGVWHKVRYSPTFPVHEEGKLKLYRTVGELYEDLDFDGQFDLKEIHDSKSAIISQSIFLKDEWRELGRMDSDGRFNKRRGAFDPNDLSAYTEGVDTGKGTYFDFVWGKGWQERPEKPSEAGTKEMSHEKAGAEGQPWPGPRVSPYFKL